MRIVNTELLASPYNWIIVTLMILFAVISLTLLQPLLGFDTSATPSE